MKVGSENFFGFITSFKESWDYYESRKRKHLFGFIPMVNGLLPEEGFLIQTIRTSDYIHAQLGTWKMLPLGFRHRKDSTPDPVLS